MQGYYCFAALNISFKYWLDKGLLIYMKFIEFSPAKALARDFLRHPEGPYSIMFLDNCNPNYFKPFE